MNLAMSSEISAILANVATFLGIPLAVFVYYQDRRRARRDREEQTYQALQSEYSEFLKLCLEYPGLQLHDFQRDTSAVLTSDQRRQQMVGFEIMVSMFESAFYLYGHDHQSEFKRRQWTGWDQYIRDWVGRNDFRQAWNIHLGAQFDSEFLTYMESLMNEVAAAD